MREQQAASQHWQQRALRAALLKLQILSQSLQRLQATMKGAVVRTHATASKPSQSAHNMTAMEAALLQSDMVAWRQRQQASQARTTLSATTTMALVIRRLKRNTQETNAVRIQSLIRGARVRQRLQAVSDWTSAMDAKV